MIIEGNELYFERGEQGTVEVTFVDEDGNEAEVQSARMQIFTVESKEVVYTADSLVVDVSGLDAGVYWYQLDAETTLGSGRIGPHRLYVSEGKE